jgi:hypothetical protein
MSKGYKAFDKDLKCRGFQFEVGKTYEIKEDLMLCSSGFHFCEKLENVYGYYPREADTRICEIEAVGKIQKEDDKSCTNKIRVVKEIVDKELINAILKGNNSGDYNSGHYNSGHYNSGDYNSGSHNSGHYNSGDRNSGHYNSGDYNSGDRNSGYYNSGHYNSGDYNSGYYNSGHYNSGDYNSGDRNSGDRNSGDYNSGDRNSGYLNSTTPTVRLFNKDSKLEFNDSKITTLGIILQKVKPLLTWIYESSMTEKEKTYNPSYKTTGGFLKNEGRMSWVNVTKKDLEFIKSLPNFSSKVFKEVTGLDINKEIKERSK